MSTQDVNTLKLSAMKKNVGSIDSIIRLIIAAAIAVLIYVNVITGVAAIILGIVDLVILFTVFFNFCPVYALFKCNTRTIKEEDKA